MDFTFLYKTDNVFMDKLSSFRVLLRVFSPQALNGLVVSGDSMSANRCTGLVKLIDIPSFVPRLAEKRLFFATFGSHNVYVVRWEEYSLGVGRGIRFVPVFSYWLELIRLTILTGL